MREDGRPQREGDDLIRRIKSELREFDLESVKSQKRGVKAKLKILGNDRVLVLQKNK